MKKSTAMGTIKDMSPYDGESEQKMIDSGTYPDGYPPIEGTRPPKPNYIKDMREMLSRPRLSLSPSIFSVNAFQDCQDCSRQAKAESQVMTNVVSVISGSKDVRYKISGDKTFLNIKKFDPSITAPFSGIYLFAASKFWKARCFASSMPVTLRCALALYPGQIETVSMLKGGVLAMKRTWLVLQGSVLSRRHSSH